MAIPYLLHGTCMHCLVSYNSMLPIIKLGNSPLADDPLIARLTAEPTSLLTHDA